MYYLQSRYYNPQTTRFVNADDVESFELLNGPLDLNLYAYTVNSPVFLTDGCGEGWLKDLVQKAANKVKKAATAVVGAVQKVASTVKKGIKKVCTSIGDFFTNTVWKKWLVEGFWNTFCKKWVWETFCKDWIADKAWKWINGNKWYQISAKSVLLGLIGLGVGAFFVPITLETVLATLIVLVITFI